MTTEQTRKLELMGDDGQSETARFIDELFARVEALEARVAALTGEAPVLVQSGAYDERD